MTTRPVCPLVNGGRLLASRRRRRPSGSDGLAPLLDRLTAGLRTPSTSGAVITAQVRLHDGVPGEIYLAVFAVALQQHPPAARVDGASHRRRLSRGGRRIGSSRLIELRHGRGCTSDDGQRDSRIGQSFHHNTPSFSSDRSGTVGSTLTWRI